MDLMWFGGRFVFAGADTTAMVSSSDGGGAAWGLRLAPGIAHAMLGVPACELADQRVDLSDLAEVSTAIRDVAPDDPAAALERVFVTMWRQVSPERELLRLAGSLDHAARMGLSVRDIAVQHGMSERTLRRVSDRLFGYSPKALASIHRFQRALSLAQAGTPLGEAAVLAGYVDQPHLNREAQRLAGTSPGFLLGRFVQDQARTGLPT
jgi:AraC-like DNA-binding protein